MERKAQVPSNLWNVWQMCHGWLGLIQQNVSEPSHTALVCSVFRRQRRCEILWETVSFVHQQKCSIHRESFPTETLKQSSLHYAYQHIKSPIESNQIGKVGALFVVFSAWYHLTCYSFYFMHALKPIGNFFNRYQISTI